MDKSVPAYARSTFGDAARWPAWSALGAAAAALLLCGCSTGGAPSGAAAPRTADSGARAAPDRDDVAHEAYAQIGYRLVWRGFPIMADRARPLHFDVFDDVLLVHNTNNVITLMEAGNGANRWSNELAGRLTRFVGNVRHDDQLLCSSDNELFILDIATGQVQDRQDLDLVINTEPVVSRDVVVYASTIGQVLGHSLITRHKLWAYQLQGSIDAAPTLVGDLVGVVSQGGDAIIIEPTTGSARSRARVYGGLRSDPVGSGDAMFLGSTDQSVYAIGAQGGEILWRHRTEWPIRSQPVHHDGALYITVPEEGFVKFNAATGEVLWRAKEAQGRAIGIRDGRLLVWDGETCAALDPRSGDVLAQATLPSVKEIEMSDFVDGDLYTVSPQGVVARFAPR